MLRVVVDDVESEAMVNETCTSPEAVLWTNVASVSNHRRGSRVPSCPTHATHLGLQVVPRRYSDFEKLYQELIRDLPAILDPKINTHSPELPGKRVKTAQRNLHHCISHRVPSQRCERECETERAYTHALMTALVVAL